MSDKLYQRRHDYMPNSDSGFRDWICNFSKHLSDRPAMYGLSESDAAIVSRLREQYEELYNLCQSTATRTTGLVTQKDAIRASAKSTCRVYARQLKANMGLTNQQKIDLGLHLNDEVKSPIGPPESAPVLTIPGLFPGEHIIHFADRDMPKRRSRPPGVTQLELYVHIGPFAVVDPTKAKFAGVYTRNPIHYALEPEDSGLVSTYFARWRTARGLPGPYSMGIAMMIAFGGPVNEPVPGLKIEGVEDRVRRAA